MAATRSQYLPKKANESVLSLTSGFSMPFTGRKEELRMLTKELEQAALGKGRLVFLSGEVGVGKSRLAQEFVNRARELGIMCLSARCMQSPESFVYSPWIEFLRKFSEVASAQLFFKTCGTSTDQIVRLVPELFQSTHSAGENEDTSFSNGSSSREQQIIQREESQFLLGLSQVFFRLSENAPLLMVIDDLQWCDPASIKTINFLVENGLEKKRVMLLCIYRDSDLGSGESNPQVSRFISQSSHANEKFASIVLSRFGQENLSHLIDSIFSCRKKDGEGSKLFGKVVYSRTGGNPLFIQETLRSLLESGAITRSDEGFWILPKNLEQLRIPNSIKKVIEQRLDRLDAPTLSTLEISSVLGEKINFEILKGISQIEDGVLLKSLNRAADAGLVFRGASSKRTKKKATYYAFSDESIRDVLYERIDIERRAELHRRAGAALESEYKSQGRDIIESGRVSELAYHFQKGGDEEKAQYYFIASGKRAAKLYAHAVAYSSFQSALDILEKGKNAERELSRRASLLQSMGDESQFLPEYTRTFECWSKAAQLYEQAQEKQKAAEIFVKLGTAYHLVMYELDKSAAALQRALELVKSDDASSDDATLARLYTYAMTVDIWRGDRVKLKSKSDIALKLAQKSGALDAIAMISSFSISSNVAHEVDEAIKSCERGLEISLKHGFIFEASFDYFHRASAFNYTYGPCPKSLGLYLEGLNFAQSRGNFMVSLFNKVEMVYGVYLPLGDWLKAREVAEECLESVVKFAHTSLFYLVAESAFAHVLLSEGELEKAEEHFEHVKRVTNGFGVLQLDVPLYVALAILNLEKRGGGEERYAQVEKYLLEGYRLSKQRGLSVINGVPHVQLLTLMVEFLSGDFLKGETSSSFLNTHSFDSLLQELREASKEIGKDWVNAYYSKAEGLVAEKKRELGFAEERLQTSAQIFGTLGWPYERAKVLHHLSRIHLAKGNVRSGINALDEALLVFKRLGAKCDMERVLATKKRIEDDGFPMFDEKPKFENKNSEVVFESLKAEYMQDFIFKKMDHERCGWRTMGELAKSLKISKHLFYGRDPGARGPVLHELIKLGAIESRVVAGERGRGGEITKVRIAYYSAPTLKKQVIRTKSSQ